MSELGQLSPFRGSMPATVDATIAEEVQASNIGQVVTLYQLDASEIITDGYYYFTNTLLEDGSSVVFDSQTYTPIDFESEGWEYVGSGPMPRPKFRLGNATQVVAALVIEGEDLVGATLRRIRTLRQHLDDGTDPDPLKTFPIEEYVINRKSAHNKIFIEWELISVLDLEGLMLPRRQCLASACTHRYRRWDSATSQFIYTKATCPYSGSSYYTRLGTPTDDPSEDDCGHLLSDCKLRHGVNSELPTRQMPALGL